MSADAIVLLPLFTNALTRLCFDFVLQPVTSPGTWAPTCRCWTYPTTGPTCRVWPGLRVCWQGALQVEWAWVSPWAASTRATCGCRRRWATWPTPARAAPCPTCAPVLTPTRCPSPQLRPSPAPTPASAICRPQRHQGSEFNPGLSTIPATWGRTEQRLETLLEHHGVPWPLPRYNDELELKSVEVVRESGLTTRGSSEGKLVWTRKTGDWTSWTMASRISSSPTREGQAWTLSATSGKWGDCDDPSNYNIVTKTNGDFVCMNTHRCVWHHMNPYCQCRLMPKRYFPSVEKKILKDEKCQVQKKRRRRYLLCMCVSCTCRQEAVHHLLWVCIITLSFLIVLLGLIGNLKKKLNKGSWDWRG